MFDAIKKKDKKRFLFTVEVDPAYGKYHWTGHRNHNVSLSPKQALKMDDICPVCHREMTIGVEERIELLADREQGFVPKDAIPFKRILPLSELIKTVLNIDSLYSKTVWSEYSKFIEKFGNEFNVLLNVSREDLEKITEKNLVDIIMLNREGKIKVIPGYDGVYGQPVLDEIEFKKFEEKQKNVKIQSQKRLFDFK
jgi:PHP family Zn ribbon phosphoesterase